MSDGYRDRGDEQPEGARPISPAERTQWQAAVERLLYSTTGTTPPPYELAEWVDRLLAALTAAEGERDAARAGVGRLLGEINQWQEASKQAIDAIARLQAERDAARTEAAELRDQLETAQAQIEVMQWGLDAAARGTAGILGIPPALVTTGDSPTAIQLQATPPPREDGPA